MINTRGMHIVTYLKKKTKKKPRKKKIQRVPVHGVDVRYELINYKGEKTYENGFTF